MRHESENEGSNLEPAQQKKSPHIKRVVKKGHTNHGPLFLPEMLTPNKTRHTSTLPPPEAHYESQPSTAEHIRHFKSLLESTLTSLIIIQSTSNTPLQHARDSLVELTKLVTTPAPANRTDTIALTPLSFAKGKIKRSHADTTKPRQAQPPIAHTKRSLPASHPGQPPHPPRASSTMSQSHCHSPHCLIVQWPGHAIPRLSTAVTTFVKLLECDINPDYCTRRHCTTKILAANVTQLGNLVIHTKAPYIAIQLKPHVHIIHNAATTIPDFSPPKDTLPLVKLDVPWHSMVVHNLPTTFLLDAYTGATEGKGIWDLLEEE